MQRDDQLPRRKVIGGIGTVAAVGLAGCIGSNEGGSKGDSPNGNGSQLEASKIDVVFDNLNEDIILEVPIGDPRISGTIGFSGRIPPISISQNKFWLYFESTNAEESFSRKTEIELEEWEIDIDDGGEYGAIFDRNFDAVNLNAGDEFMTEIRVGKDDFSTAKAVTSQESVAIVPDVDDGPVEDTF